MSSPSRKWIRQETASAIHEAQIAEHGGSLGIRDVDLLESALARPRNADSYGDPRPSIPELGALYAISIIRSHPFIDGNKRVGFVLMELFMELNGYRLDASDEECLTAITPACCERSHR